MDVGDDLPALSALPYGRILNSLWIGSRGNPNFGLDLIIIIIIIIIIVNWNWVVTRWQWLFYMYTKHEIGYY